MQYTKPHENAHGQLNQQWSIKQSTIPLIPDNLDPDKEINEWVEDTASLRYQHNHSWQYNMACTEAKKKLKQD